MTSKNDEQFVSQTWPGSLSAAAESLSCNVSEFQASPSKYSLLKSTCEKYQRVYGHKSDPDAKVIPKPNYVWKTAKLISKWAKLILN